MTTIESSGGLIEVLKGTYALSAGEWDLISEVSGFEGDMDQIGEFLYRHSIEERMALFLEELKETTMETTDVDSFIGIANRFPFEYVFSLVVGFLDTPSKEDGCNGDCNQRN